MVPIQTCSKPLILQIIMSSSSRWTRSASSRAKKRAIAEIKALTPDRTPPKKTKRERSTPVTCETSKSQSLKNSLGHTETIGVMTSTDVSTAPAHYFTILPDRSAKSSKALKFVGAHVGISGGPQNAIREALAINAKAFALFVRSARTWKCPPLAEEAVEAFKEKLVESELNPQMIVVHGSYLINPGSPDEEVRAKSRLGMLDEMQRCEMLGLPYYNIHPGSTCGKISVPECIDLIAENANAVLKQTSTVTLLFENMSCQGHTIGGHLTELATIIAKIDKVYQNRVGVCLDTCHAFAAGNDISTREGWDSFMDNVERTVGIHRLKAFHLNDSMFACGARRDRHAIIGKGMIGVETFRYLMNDPRTNNLPMILETEGHAFEEEISLLYSLCAEE